MPSIKKKCVELTKCIKESKLNANILQAPVKDAFCERKQNMFRMRGRLKCLQNQDFFMESMKKPKNTTPVATLQWNSQQSVIKAEDMSSFNKLKLECKPCAKGSEIYKTFKNLVKIEPESLQSSAAWNPFIHMRRINGLLSSDRTGFLTKENIKNREKRTNLSVEKEEYFENSRCHQSSKNCLHKITDTSIAAYALLQPKVRLKRMDLKVITNFNNELVSCSTNSHAVLIQNKKDIVKGNAFQNHVTHWPLRSSRQTPFQLVQNKIFTCRRSLRQQFKNQGKTQNQSYNNLDNLFPKPLKREPVDLIASRGLNNEPVRTLPKPIRVKHELNLKNIQPIVKLQRLKFLQKENGNKKKCMKLDFYNKSLQPVVELQRLNLKKEKVINNPFIETFFDTLKLKNMIKPKRVQLHTSTVKKQSRRFNLLQKQTKKCMRETIFTAIKSMQPKVKLKRLKLTNEKTGNQSFAGQLKAEINLSNSVPLLRLKRLELKYFLQLKSGRFLLTDTCLRKKQKNSLKFKPIPVKLEELQKFDYLINPQRRINCSMIEIKQEIDFTEAQSSLMLGQNQRLENSTSAFRPKPNGQLNRPNMCSSTLKEVNFNNSNFISIKIEPVDDNEILTGDN